MYVLRRATTGDAGTVVKLLTERAAWLADRGYDQWSEKDPARDTQATIESGETWLLVNSGGDAVGTMTITTRPDPDFWSASATALYLSKLATRVDMVGLRMGEALVHAACLYGLDREIAQLRWDVWRTNTKLQAYYQSIGARPEGLVEVPGRQSGALFTLHTSFGPALRARASGALSVDGKPGVIGELSTRHLDAPSIIGHEQWDPFQAQGQPTHFHVATGLFTERSGPVRITPTIPDPQTLHYTGDTWRLNGHPVTGEALAGLHRGLPYQLQHQGVGPDCRVDIVGDLVNGDRALQLS